MGMIYYVHFRRRISDVHVHFIWQVDLVVHFIWQLPWGVYLNLYTSSENMSSYLMSMCTSSDNQGGISDFSVHLIWIWTHIWCPCALHLVHFIWQLGGYIWFQHSLHLKSWLFRMGCHWTHRSGNTWCVVTTHNMSSWTLKNLCRLLYVVVIVVTISYSCCYFLSLIVHA